ncbi:MAG TPA: hypothetical protein VNE21_05405 [Mycobacteriales bacterium]|nr:hypothetical protein [Mycobacteriales bacterium]
MAEAPTPTRPWRVLVYSSSPGVRERIRSALGQRPARDLTDVEYVDCGTAAEVLAAVDTTGIDLAILDGEAAPTGGLGLCRQIKDEIVAAPPLLVVIGRRDDAWLATWARADSAVPHPIDPIRLAEAVSELLRARAGTMPAGR